MPLKEMGSTQTLRGESAADLFQEAALVFCQSISPLQGVVPQESRIVRLQAADLPSLLLAWLQELHHIFESEGTLFSRAHVRVSVGNGGEHVLSAQLWGERCDPATHARLASPIPADYDHCGITPPDHEGEPWLAQLWSDP